MDRLHWAGLGLITAAAAAIRLSGLTYSLRIDEIEAWAGAQAPLGEILTRFDRLPHTSLLLRAAMHTLGDSEPALRLPFLVFGVLAVPTIYLAGRLLFDRATGLAAAVLLAVAPMHVFHSQEARYYAPFVFYSLCAFIVAWRLAGTEERRRPLLWGIFWGVSALNAYTHLFALYPLVLSVGTILWGRWNRTRLARPSGEASWLPAAGLAALILLAGPAWYYLLLWQQGGSDTLIESYVLQHLLGPFPFSAIAREAAGGSPAAALLCGLAILGGALNWKSRRAAVACLWLWIVLPVASLFLIKSKTHFELRYFIFLLPLGLLLAASGAAATAERLARGAWMRIACAGAILAAVVAAQAPALAAYQALPLSRLRETVKYISERCGPQDAVFLFPQWSANWHHYYPTDPCRLYNLGILTSSRLPEFVRSHDRVWLAATWVQDPRRRAFFERQRVELKRYYDEEVVASFSSRNPNDSGQVYSYRRNAVPPPSRARRQAFDPSRGGVRLLGNIKGFVHDGPPGTYTLWTSTRGERLELASVAVGSSLRTAADREEALYVWAGSIAHQAAAGRTRWRQGDLLELPTEKARIDALEDSVLLRLSWPLRRPRARTRLLMRLSEELGATTPILRPLLVSGDRTLLLERLPSGVYNRSRFHSPWGSGITNGLSINLAGARCSQTLISGEIDWCQYEGEIWYLSRTLGPRYLWRRMVPAPSSMVRLLYR